MLLSFRLRSRIYRSAQSSALQAPCRADAGGAEEIRTPDLLLAKEALSQLSYGPAIVETLQAAMRPGLSGGPWWTRTTDLGLIRTAL